MSSLDYLAALSPQDNSRYVYVRPQLEFLLWDRFVEAIVGVWFFVVGASVGSFLNVVVYRLPLGLSLVSQGSRCPFCMTPILFRDNLPILGWLGLKGRCRACRLPISSRYPIVETLIGLMFLFTYGAELANGGSRIPNSWFPLKLAIGDVVLDGRWDLIGLYFYHVFFLCLLGAAALMAYDAKRPPLKIWLTGFVVMVVAVASWPWLYPQLVNWGGGYPQAQVTLYPVPFWPISGVLPLEMHRSWTDALTALIGLAGGAGVSLLLDRFSFQRKVRSGAHGDEVDSRMTHFEGDHVEAAAMDIETDGAETGSVEPNLVKVNLTESEDGKRDCIKEIRPVQHEDVPVVTRPWAAGMLIMIGMAWGWQFLVGVLLLCYPLHLLMRWGLPRLRNLRVATWALSLWAASMLLLMCWDGWQSIWVNVVSLAQPIL